jgi:hypothetical protein
MRRRYKSVSPTASCPRALSRTFAVSAALVLMAGLAGCATGSSSAEQSEEDLTPQQLAIRPYVNETDKICATARTEMAKVLGEFETHESVSGGARRKTVKVAKPEAVTTYVKSQISFLETQQVDIRKVKLPTGAPGKELETLWTKADEIIVKVKKNPQAAIYEDPFQPVAKSLKKLGFSQCFQPKRPESAEAQDSVPDTTVSN